MWRNFCISFVFMLLLAGSVRAEVVLILRREAKPAGNYVRICDIARVEGPEEQAREVGLTVLGPSPTGGDTRQFSRWDVETRLYEMGVAAAVTFSGNDVVTVYGSASRRGPAAAAGPFMELSPDPVPAARRAAAPAQAPATVPRRRLDETPPVTEAPARATNPGPADAAPGAILASMSGDATKRVALAVSNYLADRYRTEGRRRDVEVEAKIIDLSSAVPYDAHEIVVEEGMEGRVPGKAVLRLSVRDDAGNAPREVRVEADTEVYAQALVASRQLSRGDTLELHDLVVTRVRMEAGQAYLPPNPKLAVGRELTRSLKAGDPILASEAVPGQAVKRGQKVVVETSGAGWEIKAVGKAMGSGMIGDHITVEDTANRTRYTARITGRNKVAVLVDKELK